MDDRRPGHRRASAPIVVTGLRADPGAVANWLSLP
jgi:hypothetical protein